MVKHIIIWKLREDLDNGERSVVKRNAKSGLEPLKGRIEGLTEIKVFTEGLPSSNGDMMLYSEFVSADALKGYAANPEHNKIADQFVRPFTEKRSCFDFEE